MVEEIAEDLYRIEIPLPEYYPKSVNAYVLRDKERNLIIDAGLQDDICMNTVQADLSDLDIDLARTDFFITHGHGDHVGLVPKLIHPGSVLYLNRLEADFIQKMESGTFFREIQEHYRMSGFPEGDFEKIVARFVKRNFTSKDVPRFQFLKDGDIIARGSCCFICVETPGHNKGHTCLYEPDRKMFLSGDHLLKDFIPAIPGRINNDNPLKEYLLSLDKVHALDIEVVLPGHGRPFKNSRRRIEEIREHHHQRDLKVLSILREGSKSIYETSLRMTRKQNSGSANLLSVLQSFFISEVAFTHLKYLEDKGVVERRMEGQVAIYSLNRNGGS
jgi:glyoxylase-like metal-dependent hydrolase (beta-lactamase superfamily II)